MRAITPHNVSVIPRTMRCTICTSPFMVLEYSSQHPEVGWCVLAESIVCLGHAGDASVLVLCLTFVYDNRCLGFSQWESIIRETGSELPTRWRYSWSLACRTVQPSLQPTQRTSRSVTRLALAPHFSQMPFSDWLKLLFFVNYAH